MAPAPTEMEIIAMKPSDKVSEYSNIASVVIPHPLSVVYPVFALKENQERVLMASLAAIWPSDYHLILDDLVDPPPNFIAAETTFRLASAQAQTGEGGLERRICSLKGFRGVCTIVVSHVPDPSSFSTLEESVTVPNEIWTRKLRTFVEETDEEGKKVTRLTEDLWSCGVANWAMKHLIKAETIRQQKNYISK